MITRLSAHCVRHCSRPVTSSIPRVFTRAAAAMSTFKIPGYEGVAVTSVPDLSKDALLGFPAFKTWLSTVQHSLERQQSSRHEFHADPYVLRSIDVQAVDFFGGGRLGFVKMRAEVSNSRGESLPGSVFLRGGSVAILVSLTHFRIHTCINARHISVYVVSMLIV